MLPAGTPRGDREVEDESHEVEYEDHDGSFVVLEDPRVDREVHYANHEVQHADLVEKYGDRDVDLADI